MEGKMKCFNFFSLVLIILGALNWGLWGFFQFDFVAWIFNGNTTWLARLVYALIGLAGLWSIRCLLKSQHLCCGSCSSGKGGKGSCCK